MLEEVPKEGETPKFKGSVFVVLASSKEEVVEQLNRDVYVKNGVWDMSKTQIIPFKCAFRYPTS